MVMEQSTASRVGQTLGGKYLLESLLGEGGMGSVYRARNTQIDRIVAIKTLRPELAGNADIVERFLREAKAANAVGHPNVVDIIDLGHDELGAPFIVQEYLEGEDLDQYLERLERPLSVQETLDLLMPIIEALETAHSKGVVHRDLKPDNVFLLRARGMVVPKLLDFGISRMDGPKNQRLTVDGAIMGTPAYMPPEQIRNARSADASADVWAMGVMLFRVISGRLPFNGESITELLFAVMNAEIPELGSVAPGVPGSLSRVVARCLRREPTQRYPSACELARDLRHVRDGDDVEQTQVRSLRPPPPPAGPAVGVPDLALPKRAATPAKAKGPADPTVVNKPAAVMAMPAPAPLPVFASPAAAPLAVPAQPKASRPNLAPEPDRQRPSGAGARPKAGHAGVVDRARDAEVQSQTLDVQPLIGAGVAAGVTIVVLGILLRTVHRADGWELQTWAPFLFGGRHPVPQGGLGVTFLAIAGWLASQVIKGDAGRVLWGAVGTGALLGSSLLAYAGGALSSLELPATCACLFLITLSLPLYGKACKAYGDSKGATVGFAIAGSLLIFAGVELIAGMH
jgi:eukaryotic-like serine/threonine-protein kinase